MSLSELNLGPGGEQKSSYVKKADRGFAPEGLNVRPSRFGLSQFIYESIQKEEVERKQERRQRSVYASGVLDCQRQQVFSLWGLPGVMPESVKNNPNWKVTAKIGDGIHTLVTEILGREAILVDSEIKVYSPDGALTGRADDTISLFLKDSVGTFSRGRFHRAVVDVKSVGKKDFDDLLYGRKIAKYISQVQIYGFLLKYQVGVVLLVCRDDGRLFDFEFDIDPEEAKRLLARASDTVAKAEAAFVPAAEAWGTSECNFCWFRQQCVAEEEELAITKGLLDGTLQIKVPSDL